MSVSIDETCASSACSNDGNVFSGLVPREPRWPWRWNFATILLPVRIASLSCYVLPHNWRRQTLSPLLIAQLAQTNPLALAIFRPDGIVRNRESLNCKDAFMFPAATQAKPN